MPDKLPNPVKQTLVQNAAHRILQCNPLLTRSESEGTKRARAITIAWQAELALVHHLNGFVAEYPVAGLNERFDLVDTVDRVVYELKTSGNNPGHEFYKDIFKVIAHNRKQPDNRYYHFVFLVPSPGAASLNRGLGWQAMAIATEFGLNVNVWSVSEPLTLL